jgi:ABC-type uncharacterized transport system permease subunit
MIAYASGLLAALLYACGTLLQGQALYKDKNLRQPILGLGFAALVLHLVNVAVVIRTEQGYDFGFFPVATLFSWVMVSIVLLSSLRKPLENLFIVLFPIAILSLLSATFLPSYYQPVSSLDPGMALHSLLGIVAFSLITIAALQALLVAWLSRELKRHHFHPALRHVPPLQTMEALLFEAIHYGFAAMLAVILTGFLFMDDMFAQHLAHKTILTLISSAVFGVLLWGRHLRGWRGKVALRWILSGYAVLLLAYFGSKFVLELLLNRV